MLTCGYVVEMMGFESTPPRRELSYEGTESTADGPSP